MLRTNVRHKLPPPNPLMNLPVGALVKDVKTTFRGEPIVWQIADKNHVGYPENSVTLIVKKIITLRAFDAKEPENPAADCKTKGNCRYAHSNIRSWANSAAGAGGWYTPKHEYDTPPIADNLYLTYNPYVEDAGFLKTFSAKFISSMMPTALPVLITDAFGGGMEEVTDKIFLASMAEAGLVNSKNINEGTKFALFSDNASRIAYPTPRCVADSDYSVSTFDTAKGWTWWLRSPLGKDAFSSYGLTMTGSSLGNQSLYGVIGFRPLCNLLGNTNVSLETDADGAYLLF